MRQSSRVIPSTGSNTGSRRPRTEQTDLAHWLALDVTARALDDAGFTAGEGLPKAGTGVVIGNSLVGEFSRANIMRLRWPYVRRVVDAVLKRRGESLETRETLLSEMQELYKTPFPIPDADMLAGGLANTIAGRITNYFDFGGGCYTVDGACSSSLLSVVEGCRALQEGMWDVAIVGGVDLSIDPFEVIGFTRNGALARSDMRSLDARRRGSGRVRAPGWRSSCEKRRPTRVACLFTPRSAAGACPPTAVVG